MHILRSKIIVRMATILIISLDYQLKEDLLQDTEYKTNLTKTKVMNNRKLYLMVINQIMNNHILTRRKIEKSNQIKVIVKNMKRNLKKK